MARARSILERAVRRLCAKLAPPPLFVDLAVPPLLELADPLVPDGATIFLGDSCTAWLAVSAIAERAVNYGIGGQTTGDLRRYINGYGSLRRASRVFLSIGANDIGRGKTGWRDDFEAILAPIPEATPLVWSNIMPQDAHVAEIGAVNSLIGELGSARPNCIVIDTHGFLAQPDGRVRPGLYSDHMHLNRAGCLLWIETLREAAHIG